MKNYCDYFIENFARSNFNEYIYRNDRPEGYEPIEEYDSARLLYDFLSILDTQDILQLNSTLDNFFGKLKAKKSVSKRMYDFVKFLRQGDTFKGEKGGHKDMILHTLLNSTEFFEEVIFRLNNKMV